MTAPAYNDALFRQQFPAFGDMFAYPEATLAFAWSMGANWVNQTQTCWGLQDAQLQQAADLMGAVIVRQLYGRTVNGTTVSVGTPTPIGNATAGPVTSASDNGTSATVTLPEFGSSAFMSLLLSSPPYGTLLLALLQVSANVGPYIGSGRFSYVPP